MKKKRTGKKKVMKKGGKMNKGRAPSKKDKRSKILKIKRYLRYRAGKRKKKKRR